jgi:DNA-3-methyladenine glycosylase
MKLTESFYTKGDVVSLAKWFLGKYIVTNFSEGISSAYIVETEAYAGVADRGSHAYKGKISPRTTPMYYIGGHAYVYRCYGIHNLFNIVTGKANVPHAVLVRAVLPDQGFDIMKQRLGIEEISFNNSNGPGKLTKALGINNSHSGLSLCGNEIWIENRGILINSDDICISKRIGIDYAGDDANLPYRFYLKTDCFTKYFGG